MDDYVQAYFYFCLLCTVCGAAVMISKWAAVRGMEKVSGKITNVVPRYRGATYSVIIKDDGVKYSRTFYRRNKLFSSYGVGSYFEFYKVVTKYGIKYKRTESYYSWPLGLMVLPWIMLLTIG